MYQTQSPIPVNWYKGIPGIAIQTEENVVKELAEKIYLSCPLDTCSGLFPTSPQKVLVHASLTRSLYLLYVLSTYCRNWIRKDGDWV